MRRRSSSTASKEPRSDRLQGVEAIDIGGQLVTAVCHKSGVDIIDCDDGRYIQSLKETSARYAAWSLRTYHLALLTDVEISIYSHSNDLTSMKPQWTKEKHISLFPDDGGGKHQNVSGLSFQYPHMAIMQHDVVILHNCLTDEKYTLSSASGPPTIASLSFSGRTLALCAVSSPRIDFMRVQKSGCSTICHKDHSTAVKNLIWRPGFSINRDMVLACDQVNLVRIWAVEYKPAPIGSEVNAEVHLLLELCDYVDRVAPFSWVQHGLSSQAEVNFINGSMPSKKSSTSINSIPAHFSGSWLAVLDESGIVRLWCIHAHGISNHIECALKGHGPALLPFHKERASFRSFVVSGRFLSVGADKPVSLQVVGSYGLGNDSSHRRFVSIVHAETIKRADSFVASTQRIVDFLVHTSSDERTQSEQAITSGMRRLPPRITYDWQLVPWDEDGENNDALEHTPATTRSYRAMHSSLRSTESKLWCWSHRHKSYDSPNEVSFSIPFLSHDPIDLASANSGFEISHDILRTLWLPEPVVEDIESSAENERPSPGKQQMIITLQQPRLGTFVVAIWRTAHCKESSGIKNCPGISCLSLAPKNDESNADHRSHIFLQRSSRHDLGMMRNVDKRDTEISSLRSGRFDDYEVSILPDPHFGLGLRLDINDGKILVESFKKNPLTMKPMPAEECGIIGIGDELMSVTGKSLKGQSLVDVIQIIRQVVQNSRGKAINLQLRACNRTSIDSEERTQKFSHSVERTFNVDQSQGWYSSSRNHQDSDANSPNDRNKSYVDEFLVRVPELKKWNLIKSFPLDNAVAMDIVLGDYGESVASGNCTTAELPAVIAIGAAITRAKTASGSDGFELNVFEVAVSKDSTKCDFIKRLSLPWVGEEPHMLQLWNNPMAAQTLTLTVTHTSVDSNKDLTGFVTIMEIVTREALPSDSTFESDNPSFSFNESSIGWSLSSKLEFPAVFCQAPGNNRHVLRSPGLSDFSDSNNVEKWEFLCHPMYEGGIHFVMRSTSNFRELCILSLIEGQVPESLTHLMTSKSLCSMHPYGKFVQKIQFNSDVSWAKFLDDTTLQVAAGNKWYVYSLFADESSSLWMLHSEPAVFSGNHYPEALSMQSVSMPSPWLNSQVLGESDYHKRGLLTCRQPDWHPVYLLVDLFNLWPASCFSSSPVSTLNGLSESITAIQKRLGLLSRSMCSSKESLYSSFPTKILISESESKDFDCTELSKEVLLVAKSLFLNKEENFEMLKRQSNIPLFVLPRHDIILLGILTQFLCDYFELTESHEESQGKEGSARSFPPLKNMDDWAKQAFLSYKLLNSLDRLGIDESNTADAVGCQTRVSGDVVLNALVSSSQEGLYDLLIGSDVDTFTSSMSNRITRNKDFNFSMLWWARNQAGKNSSSDYDILGALTKAMAPVWLHDMTPIYDLIEKLSVTQFKDHRDSLKIFLEMVAINRGDKLLQLAKTDRNVMGKQLLKLLGMDFKSEKGRQACHKNAFALLRLQRYKHAAAVFLCADPPLLKEAVRVIIKHLKDPVLALLISRLVERRPGAKPVSGGFVLGPISRGIIENDLLPTLCESIGESGSNHSDAIQNNGGLLWGADAAMVAICCSMWLQNTEKLRNIVDKCSRCNIFSHATTCSSYGVVKQRITSCSSMKWLLQQSVSPSSVAGYVSAFDSMLKQSKLSDLRCLGVDFLARVESMSPSESRSKDAFVSYCEQELERWKADVTSYNRDLENERRADEEHEELDDVTAAMKKLQSISSGQPEDNVAEVAQALKKESKGFNLSMSAAASTNSPSPSALDMFDAPPSKPKQAPKTKTEPSNMLDMFDAPPSKPKQAPKTKTEPSNMLDMFDAPPSKPKQAPKTKTEPANMLDMFDAPPPKPKAKAKVEPASMLDMFDAPPPPKPKEKKPAKSEPANMLDMFDSPPPKPKEKPAKSEPANMLDMFDSPPPKPKEKPVPKAEPANMLDMFDSPPPKPKEKQKPKAQPASMLDMYDAPAPKRTSEAKAGSTNKSDAVDTPSKSKDADAKMSDEENPSVAMFNNGNLERTRVNFSDSYSYLSLKIGSRTSVISRCFDELQLSLGCVPTMTHPLATSGHTRELLRFICEDSRESLINSDIKRLISFRKCLRSLSSRYYDIVLPHFKSHTRSSIRNLFAEETKDDAINTPPDTLLAMYLVESVDYYASSDLLYLQVLLRWACGRHVDVNKILIASAVSVFELISVALGAAHNCQSSQLPFSASTVTYMLTTARQMQLILSLTCCPHTSHMFAKKHQLRPAVIAIVGLTIRLCLCFGSLDYRYDVTQKLLKFPPKFDFSSLGSRTSDKCNTSEDAYQQWLAKNPITEGDTGHSYFRDMDRTQAISTLKQLPKGTFLLRPHDKEPAVVYLSFVADSSGGIKHAILRNDAGPSGEPNYRCGKVGPCASVEIALRSISKILPSPLVFDSSAVPGGPSSFVPEEEEETKEATTECKESEESEHPSLTEVHFGSFAGDIPESALEEKFEVKGMQESLWDPNGEFWYSLPVPEVSLGGYKPLSHMKAYQFNLSLSPSPSSETEVNTDSYEEKNLFDMDVSNDAAANSGDEVDLSLDCNETSSASSSTADVSPAWRMPQSEKNIGSLARGIAHMLSLKTVFKQIATFNDSLSSLVSADKLVTEYLQYLVQLRYEGKIPHDMLHPSTESKRSPKDQSDKMFPRSKVSVFESFMSPFAIFVCSFERIVLNSLSPALPLDPTVFISQDYSTAESLMEQILHERIGVPLRHVKLPHSALSHVGIGDEIRPSTPVSESNSSTPKPDGDDVVECIESADVIEWIKKHTDTEVLSAIIQSKSEADVTPEHVLKWLWNQRMLQNIVIEGSGIYSSKHNFFRYIDPWEVSVVHDQAAILDSCRLGREWYSAVSAYSATSMVDSVMRHILKENCGADGGFVKLWESLRAEAWLVITISTSHEQGEREAGGPAVTELTSSTLGASDPYHSCLARHLYRNALFDRIGMPHRFVAVLQIDTFALKDLSPHKYMSGVASTPIEVYAVARLVRSTGRTSNRKALTDTLVTPARKIEAGKQDNTSQPSEYSWREQGILRFPLPDRVLAIGPFTEGGDKNIRQPPRKLQLSVYETRSFFSDQKLGELELPLSGLSDEHPFRDWLPLSSEKGAAWFVHIQMQLRFLLMTKDEFRDSTIRSKKGHSKKVKQDTKKTFSRFGTPTGSPAPRESITRKSPSLSEEENPRPSMGPIAAPVMYAMDSKDSTDNDHSKSTPKVDDVNDIANDFF